MAKEFKLYGVMNTKTGKLVSNITNPRHKYWETKGTCENALNRYKSRTHIYGSDCSLEVVEIECKIIESGDYHV